MTTNPDEDDIYGQPDNFADSRQLQDDRETQYAVSKYFIILMELLIVPIKNIGQLNVHWPAIGNLGCVLAYHWSFVLYDVIFYMDNKQLPTK